MNYAYKKYNIVDASRHPIFAFNTKTECRNFILGRLGSGFSNRENFRWFTIYRDLVFKNCRFLEYEPLPREKLEYDEFRNK